MESNVIYNVPKEALGKKNDCVVRAISTALDKPYNDVEAILKLFGRRKNSGTWKASWYPAIKSNIEWTKRFESQPTVGALASIIPQGIYIVRVAHHMLCIIDGKIYDGYDSSRSYVKEIYKIRRNNAND